METIKTWVSCIVFSVAILGLCNWLDQQGAPKDCTGQIKDAYGNKVEFHGKLVEVSVD